MKLIDAIKSTDIDTVRRIVSESGIEAVNERDKSGCTPLIYCAEHGLHNILLYLVVEAKVDVDDQDNYGSTALMYASMKGEVEVMRCLVERGGADVNLADDFWMTALMIAVQKGQYTAVKYLLEETNADASLKSRTGKVALELTSNPQIIELLLNPSPSTKQESNMNMPDTASSPAPSSSTTKASPSSTSEVLPIKRIDIWKALTEKNLEDVRLIGITDMDTFNERDASGSTPLIYCAEHGLHDILQYLVVEAKVDVDDRDNYGSTALMYASMKGEVEVMRCLVERGGADVNLADDFGSTALMIAAEKGNLAVVQYLVEHGRAALNIKHKSGKIAIEKAKTDEIRRYLENKSHPNQEKALSDNAISPPVPPSIASTSSNPFQISIVNFPQAKEVLAPSFITSLDAWVNAHVDQHQMALTIQLRAAQQRIKELEAIIQTTHPN